MMMWAPFGRRAMVTHGSTLIDHLSKLKKEPVENVNDNIFNEKIENILSNQEKILSNQEKILELLKKD